MAKATHKYHSSRSKRAQQKPTGHLELIIKRVLKKDLSPIGRSKDQNYIGYILDVINYTISDPKRRMNIYHVPGNAKGGEEMGMGLVESSKYGPSRRIIVVNKGKRRFLVTGIYQEEQEQLRNEGQSLYEKVIRMETCPDFFQQ